MSDAEKKAPIQSRGSMRGPMGGGHAMGAPVQKAKDFKGTFKRLVGYLKPFKVNLLVVFIFAVARTICTIGAPQISRLVMNDLQDSFMARMIIQKLGEAQQKARTQIALLMNPIPANNQTGATSATGDKPAANPVPQIPAETIAMLRDFMQWPLIAQAETAAESGPLPKDAGFKQSPAHVAIRGAIRCPVRYEPERGADYSCHRGSTQNRRQNRFCGTEYHYAYPVKCVSDVSTLFSFIMQYLMVAVSQKTVYQMRKQVDEKLSRLPLRPWRL